MAHVLPHKVGFTRRPGRDGVSWRVAEQAGSNGEAYALVGATATRFPAFLEYSLHELFSDVRVCRLNPNDGQLLAGGSEWVLAEQELLLQAVSEVKQLLVSVWGDFP